MTKLVNFVATFVENFPVQTDSAANYLPTEQKRVPLFNTNICTINKNTFKLNNKRLASWVRVICYRIRKISPLLFCPMAPAKSLVALRMPDLTKRLRTRHCGRLLSDEPSYLEIVWGFPIENKGSLSGPQRAMNDLTQHPKLPLKPLKPLKQRLSVYPFHSPHRVCLQ